MKKYLIMSAAALTMCIAFTSCSHDVDALSQEELDALQAQKVIKTYEQAFINTFGEPAPDQDWGFGPAKAASRTRSNPGSNYPATHKYADGGANANANEWADPNKYYGGWLVPDPLTEGQKLRVKMYFQANPNQSYNDPHYRHFFVQQVYKGATSPGSKSTEVVTAAGGQTYTSSNMNLLTVGQSNMHINDFNDGTCTMNNEVLDNKGNVNDGPYHSDQIMLMVNVDDTSCFGYHETGSSNEEPGIQHNDRAGLVSAATIDAWAASNGNPGEKVVDKWNRSFIGFDLAIKEGNQIWSGDIQSFTSGLNMNYDGIYFNDDNIVRKVYVDPDHSVDEQHPGGNWDMKWPDDFDNVMKDADGNPLKILDAKMNFYSGDVITIDDSYLRIDNNGVLLNMKKVNDELISQGYYPVSGSAFKTWVRPKHSYDNYYSDWIVTLTEAQRIPDTDPDPEPSDGDLRIIAEDLTATSANDFDFNDIVFDVYYGNPASIVVQAAGGTLPLRIKVSKDADEDSMEANADGWREVHDIFGQSTNIMINTKAEKRYPGRGIALGPSSKISLDYAVNSPDDAKNITIEVQKTVNGQLKWFELGADPGIPAAKIAVGCDYKWCDERVDIGQRYSNFSYYVKGESKSAKWWE